MAKTPKLRVLMICMGNICRSPSAEGVLRHKLREAGLEHLVEVDSAGTHDYHVGSPPDERSHTDADFERFDFVLAMDDDNLLLLEEQCPKAHQGKLGRLSQHAVRFDSSIVPDPYYGGAAAFERVLDLVEDACEGLVKHLRERLAKS